ALMRLYPHTVAAQEAAAMPQRVRGVVIDRSGTSVAGDRLFLLGFRTEGQARTFNFDFRHDTSVVKMATTLRRGGSFTAQLPPGLWYIACWDDPTQASHGYFNLPLAGDNDVFTVRALAPGSAGIIVGY